MTDPLPRAKDNRAIQMHSVSDDLRIDLKRKEALEMVVNYVPVKDIAKHFKVTPKAVYGWITMEQDALRQAMSKNSTIYKARINQTYDDLMKQWKTLALTLTNGIEFTVEGVKMIKGKPVGIRLSDWEIALAATDRVLKIAKQQAELNQIGPIAEEKQTPQIGDVQLQLIQIVQNAVKKNQVKEAEIIENNPTP